MIFDLDGVIYVGRRLTPGAAEAIRVLRDRGIRTLFATNNASTTRAGFAHRLSAMGIPCRPAEVMTAARAAAGYLKPRLARGTRLLVFGRGGTARELAAVGLKPFAVSSRDEWRRVRDGTLRVRVVVVGNIRGFNYYGVCAAHELLRRGARLIACNKDSTYPVPQGTMPGTGSLVSLLECSTGQRAVLVGKPSPFMFRMFLREAGLRAREALVVGDRIETDLAAGRAAGSRTALVLTGIASARDAARARPKPDAVAKNLPHLLRHRLLCGA